MKKIITLLLFIPLGMYSQTEEVTKVVDSVAKPMTAENATVEAVGTVETVKAETETKKEQTVLSEPVCISGDCENGQGAMNYNSGTYVGSWKNKLRHGTGSYKWTNGDVYKGTWENDKRHGQGQYIWSDGSKYKGNYSHGVRSGYGIYRYTNGNIYEGTWQNNLKHGIANFYYEKSVNIGGRYINNEYIAKTGINQKSYQYKPKN